jgi:hypothetical protein
MDDKDQYYVDRPEHEKNLTELDLYAKAAIQDYKIGSSDPSLDRERVIRDRQEIKRLLRYMKLKRLRD